MGLCICLSPCRCGTAVVKKSWGPPFNSSPTPTLTVCVSMDYCLQQQTPQHQLETTQRNESSQGKAMLLLKVLLKWKSKVSQQRCFHRQDGQAAKQVLPFLMPKRNQLLFWDRRQIWISCAWNFPKQNPILLFLKGTFLSFPLVRLKYRVKALKKKKDTISSLWKAL